MSVCTKIRGYVLISITIGYPLWLVDYWYTKAVKKVKMVNDIFTLYFFYSEMHPRREHSKKCFWNICLMGGIRVANKWNFILGLCSFHVSPQLAKLNYFFKGQGHTVMTIFLISPANAHVLQQFYKNKTQCIRQTCSQTFTDSVIHTEE